MAWATVDPDATFTTRMAARVIYPADFVYLNWPTGVIRACTHHESVTDQDGNTWTGVGRVGFVRPAAAEMSGAAQRWEVGLTGLPVDSSTNEADAVGSAAEVYLGNADAGFGNWKLDLAFAGFVQSAGIFEFRREEGRILMDVKLTLGDQRNPNRGVQFYHSMNDGGSWAKCLGTVKESKTFPAD